nr:uncharacterized protein LOC106618972 [Bactrocera oleae]XP_014092401.1 uncharacterized protein LOC106618972 [Bactrocera oleae]XP_014092402.1 uncharacterized protein LOC106618972 [Bactrocera oleae]XP_036234310.1 uncharacterized protein LOC106618972 [Bactrocera oleae]XP_036234311.1 uncharacterized protein LOC106618972 [Bactrocera oleae]XP_036234313.1 uncharacterized protein LOC106618972 [Bactrocera oleae]XP_036234314.1 uncharacterized protein LOC106618972 [Bactrocera oleae]
MSCQHVSRLITTAATSVLSEDQDPYVFTETVPTTPPILFNAQKSRSKVYIDANAITTTPTPIQSLSPTPAISAAVPTIATPTPAALAISSPVTNKRQTPIVTTNAKLKFNQKLPLGPLNGNNTKTQTASTLAAATGHNGPSAAAASKAVSLSTVKTTNSQSQKQHQQHKKALNVCIVRPQQQQQQTQAVRQQQNYKAQRKQASSPPPLFQHTPSLWQTPLLLDTGSAVVSPPTSPASLPSPPIAVPPTPTSVTLPFTAATAMVSPLITVSATTLPPSKFHHNTLAQHLQKLECIKKPKKPISGGNVLNGKPTKHIQMQQNIQEQDIALKHHQPSLLPQQRQQQLSGIGAKTVIQPTAALLQAHVVQQPQSQKQMHKSSMAMPSAPPPLQAIQAISPPQHSDPDLNEIPVNVIFRKPQTSEMLHTQLSGGIRENAVSNTACPRSSSVDNTSVNRRGSAIEIINKTSSTKTKSKSISTAVMAAKTVTLPPSTLQPFPHVLRDIVFTHTRPTQIAPSEDTSRLPAHIYNTPHLQPPATIHNQQQNMSSISKPSPPTSAQPQKYETTTPAQLVQPLLKLGEVIKNAGSEGKSPQKVIDTQNVIAVVKATAAAAKNSSKRKSSATATALSSNKNHLLQYAKKRSHKLGPLFRTYDNQMVVSGIDLLECNTNSQKKRTCHAVAVVKMSSAEIEADTTLLASDVVLPYCIQKHWLFITHNIQLVEGVDVFAAAAGKGVGSLDAILQGTSDRETQITHRKMLLRRQAMQLLSTQPLQVLPMQAAKRRLMCVDRLLRKYARHGGDDIITPKNCNSVGCSKGVLEIAAQCEDHIVDNISQHIFLPCTAKFADNTQCRIPVFDIMHDLPLCVEHARKRDAYNRVVHDQQRVGSHKLTTATVDTAMTQSSLDCDAGDLLRQLQQIQHQHKQQQRQQQQTHMQHNLDSTATVGKNKKCVNIKATTTRKRKVPNTAGSNTVGRPQKRSRKRGTNESPSGPVVSVAVAPMQLTSAVLQRKGSTTSLESIASNSQSSNSQPHYISSNISVKSQTQIAMPALAPLSGHNAPIVSSTLTVGSVPKRMLNFSTSSRDSAATLGGTENVMAQNLKPHEINQLVAQFSVTVSSNNNNNNENSNSLTAYSNSSMNNTYNYMSSNCDSNFTSALGSSSSLPSSTEELFRQELLSVCENSSVYASSEDTGLGGLSETELMVGPNDADDIPLGDTRLLEEHDLANVLSALPEDAFNELFTAVHQEEREEVERALELADKHLKSLQQTIGSDIDFLGEFPDDDDILADTDVMCSKMGMMHSPDATSGIDTSTLFIDSGSNSVGGGGGGSLNSSNIADIRGLVQT